ncbi:MAG TPA: type VII secretion-associated serine protease mycosin [Mycobacteriales bacterium]|jgi:Subtilisin-like serine proteases
MRSLRPLAAAVGVVALCLTTGVFTAPGALATPGVDESCNPKDRGSPNSTEPWGQQRLDFQRVWPLTQGQGVLVAEVDSGVDHDHPQLSDPSHVLPTVDLTGTGTGDCDGHGTRVAGIIVGADLHRPNVVFTGVAPGARLLPIKQTSTGESTVRLLADGIRTAVDHGATVVNVSITGADAPVLRDAVRYAQEHDVVIVAAAGNEKNGVNTTQYPAGYTGVISVAAIDEKDQHASFTIPATPVSVAAPGVHVTSTAAGPAHGYTVKDGTSFAAPFVAGVAALVRSYHPGLNYRQVEHRIEVTADRRTDPALGFGVVNPYQAVTAVLPEEISGAAARPAPRPVPPIQPLRPPDTHTRDLALVVAGIAALATCLVVSVAVVVPRGRRRHWRPGQRRLFEDVGTTASAQ